MPPASKPIGLIAFATVLLFGAVIQAQEEHSDEQSPRGFAVVELFTSQGCSSCPPADANLAHLKQIAEERGLKVFPLSFHVDYWNRLGWEDPYSSAVASNRQQQYARVFESSRVYTPQMVVNGSDEFVGSNAKIAGETVTSALTAVPAETLNLELQTDETTGQVSLQFESSSEGERIALNVALVQTEGGSEVERGENAGRSLRHVNIVRDFQVLPVAQGGSGVAPLSAEVIAAGAGTVIAYVQDLDTGYVFAAASVDL